MKIKRTSLAGVGIGIVLATFTIIAFCLEWDVSEASAVATAGGTIACALLALFGDSVRSLLYAPRLHLSVDRISTTSPVPIGGTGGPGGFGWYFHLTVSSKGIMPTRSARVTLERIEKVMSGDAVALPLAIPLQMRWAPAELGRQVVDIASSAKADFFSVRQDSAGNVTFELLPLTKTFDFDRIVSDAIQKSTPIRLWFRVESENGRHGLAQAFDVTWDGSWPKTRDDIDQSIQIKEFKNI